MKTVGITAEYNPFHNGHAYHIKRARQVSQADYCIVIMSGPFVQRGAPALSDKYTRARAALENGADLVLELPVMGAASSAEYFSRCAVSILDRLGVVTDLAFGCEASSDDLPLLSDLARLFAEEPGPFREDLFSFLKAGESYPTARMHAACRWYDRNGQAGHSSQIKSILMAPNNILAIEYMKALFQNRSSIQPHFIRRQGAGHHSGELSETFASGSAIRQMALQKDPDPASILRFLPPSCRKDFLTCFHSHSLLCEDDFSSMLYYAIRSRADSLTESFASHRQLARRAVNLLEHFSGWSDFAGRLKTKNQTYTAISRFLLHILLGMDDVAYSDMTACDSAPYARVLGMRRSSSALLKSIQEHAQIPVIVRLSDASSVLNTAEKRLLHLDLFASDLYNQALAASSGSRPLNDFRHPLVFLD